MTCRGRTTMALLMTAALLAAAPARAQKKFDTTITVGIIGGTWVDLVNSQLKDEMAAAGITMKFVGGHAEDFLPKFVAAHGQHVVDVVEIDDFTYDDFRKGNFLAKLNLANIPNVSDLDHSMYNDYRVGYWGSEPGIIYNVDRFKAAHVPPPQHYSDLANPALAGHVEMSDIDSYLAFYQVIGLAYENGGNETNPQPGFDFMAKMKLQSYGNSVATVLQLFKSGDVWAATVADHTAIRLFNAGINAASVHPVINGHRGALARGYLGVARDSANQAAAEYFINAIIAPRMQEKLYEENATIPVSNTTLAKVVQKVKLDASGTPFLQLQPEAVAQTWAPDFTKIDRRNWVRQWQNAVAAQPR